MRIELTPGDGHEFESAGIAYMMLDCPTCKGEGAIEDGGTSDYPIRCGTCDGSGVIEVLNGELVEPDARAEGK